MPAPKDPVKYAIYHKKMQKTWDKNKGNKYSVGVKQSEELRKKRKVWMAGENNPMFGKTHSSEAREKIRKAPKCRGEKHPAWKGGKDKWWRVQVLKLQDSTCQRCGLKDEIEGFMDVDHIKPKKRFPELRREVSNGQVLCPNCHRRKGLEDLKNHLQQKI